MLFGVPTLYKTALKIARVAAKIDANKREFNFFGVAVHFTSDIKS